MNRLITFITIALCALLFSVTVAAAQVQAFKCGSEQKVVITVAADASVTVECQGGPPGPIATDTPVPLPTVTPEPLPTDTLVSLPTDTPVPLPTVTPEPATPTLAPTAVVIPSPTPGQLALVDYPLCPSHNEGAWHGTIDSVRQCHYDHTHGDDPSTANDIFGNWVFGDKTISYPHASSPAENMYQTYIMSNTVDTSKKHAGYFYFVQRNIPNSPVSLPNWNTPVDSYIRDIRLQAHFWGVGDTAVRFHSSYYEIRVQSKATGAYGMIKVGGLMDTGILELYKQQWVPIAGQDPDFATYSSQFWYPGYNDQAGKSIDNYRGYKQTCAQIQQRMGNQNFWDPLYNMTSEYTSLSSDVLWSFAPGMFGSMNVAGASIEKFDAPDCVEAGPVNIKNPYAATYQIKSICQMGGREGCRLNGSEVSVFMVFVQVKKEWDNGPLDTNRVPGIVSLATYTDQKQNIASGCTAPSYACIPLILIDMPVGQAFYQKSGNGKTFVHEFDQTPATRLVNGKWESWLKQ